MQLFEYQDLAHFARDKADEAARIVIILVGSAVLIWLLRRMADRLVRIVHDDDPLATSEREFRALTLAGVFKSVTRIAVILFATLMIMQTCGFETGPLIAGAGVAGLAISFGAQNLIRDYISGFFILVENQYKVGDVIKTAGVSGQVEDMNLRVTVLRDLEGVAHFIPNGEIKVVSNLAKGWSRAVVSVGITYKEDLDRVISILKDVGDQLVEDSRFGPNILSSPEVLGVESLEESQVLLRVLVKTRALKQWEIARELRKRIKMTFDRHGIEIPAQRVVYCAKWPEPPESPPKAEESHT